MMQEVKRTRSLCGNETGWRMGGLRANPKLNSLNLPHRCTERLKDTFHYAEVNRRFTTGKSGSKPPGSNKPPLP